jgi:hypothetical protein
MTEYGRLKKFRNLETFQTVAVECSRMFQNSDSLVFEIRRACETEKYIHTLLVEDSPYRGSLENV